MRQQIIYLILLGCLSIFCQELRLFSPFSVFQIDLNKKVCQNGETKNILTFVLNSVTYAAVNQGICGFTVYTLQGANMPIIVFQDSILGESCTSLYYLSTSQSLIVGFSNGNLCTYQFGSTLNSNQILQSKKISTLPNFKAIYFMRTNTKIPNNLFFFSQDSLITIQITHDSEIQQVQSLPQSFANAFQIDVIKNTQQYIFAATQNQGVQFTQIIEASSNNNNGVTYSLGNVCYLNPLIYTITSFDMLNSNVIVMMQVILGVYVYDISGYFNSLGQNCQFTLLYRIPQSTLGNKIVLSADKTYAYASYKSVGIYIYQITTSSATLVQTIWQIGNGDHVLSENGSILLTTNSMSFLGYQATTPNLNNIIPNLLLNYEQIQRVPAVPKPGQDRDCMYNEQTKLIFAISPSYSFLVMRYQGNGIFQNLFTQINSGLRYIVYALMLNDGKTVIAATRSNGIAIMDFSNPSQPVYVKEGISFGIPQLSIFTMEITQDQQMIALIDDIRAIFVNIADPQNPQLISIYDITTNGSLPPLQRAVFSNDYKIIYLGTVFDAVVAVDISSIANPVFISKIAVEGVNQLRITQDGKHLILAQVFKGMVCVDVSNPMNMQIVSSVTVIGAALSVQLINNDQYILMTSTGNPSIKLIDFRNRTNPIDYQLFFLQSRREDYVQICKTNNDQTIFVTSENFLIQLNLKNTLNLHTQIYNVQQSTTSNQQQLTIIDPSKPFLVGQTIQMSFMNVLDTAQLSIIDAYFYTSNTIQSLPSWIIFSQISNYILLKITKESITSSSSEQIVLKVLREIQDNAFINTFLSLGKAQSLILKNSCIKSHYIDSSNLVSQQFDSQGYFELNPTDLNSITTDPNQQSLITQFVLFTLKSNIVYYTIPIQIEPSLSVDFNNLNKPIASNENSLSVYLTCENPSLGQFVNEIYPSVLVVYSASYNQIKLEGTLESINQILMTKVKFHNSTDLSQIYINVQVSDGINFDFIETYLITELPIIDLQKRVTIEESKSLQEYFNDKYTDSQLAINSYFSFQIPKMHYISDQNYPLTYTMYLLNSVEYDYLIQIYQHSNISDFQNQYNLTLLPSSYWIQFSSAAEVITGMPDSSNLFNRYYLMINVTDGYTFVIEPLEIYVNQVPFSFIMQLMIQIGGPLIGILGLWKFKYVFFNSFYEQHYLYSSEKARVGDIFQKSIYIYGDSLPIAIEICKKFLPIILPNKFIEDQVFSHISQYKKSQLNESITSPQNITEFYNQAVNQRQADLSGVIQTKGNMPTNIVNNTQKNPEFKLESNSFVRRNKQETSKILNEALRISRKLRSYSQSRKISINESQIYLFEPNGLVNIPYILQMLLNNLTASIKYKDKVNLIADLQNPKSSLYKIISGLAILFIKDRVKTSDYIFKNMRSCALAKYGKKDWYRLYVDIDQLHLSNDQADICFFSSFKINHQQFNQDFEESQSFIQNINKEQFTDNELTQTLSTLSLIIQLVQGSIIATAQGISYDKRGLTFRGQGESINCDQHFIKTIKGYQKSSTSENTKSTSCFKHWSGSIYKEKFLIHNQMIPSWIKKVELVNSIIIIQGIPNKQNIGKTLLKILDESNVVQFAFEIDIIQSQDLVTSQQSENFLASEFVSRFESSKSPKKAFLSNDTSQECELNKSPIINALAEDQINEKERFQLVFSPKPFLSKSNHSIFEFKN